MIRKTFTNALALLTLFATAIASHSAAQSFPAVDGIVPSDLTQLKNETLRGAFAGRTMDGTYKFPTQRSGTHYFTETFTKDGHTVYREGDINDKGFWVIVDEVNICFRYTGAMAGSISCFMVFKDGNCLYSYNPSRIIAGRPLDPNMWSAKTAIRGEVSGCDDLIM